MSFVYPWVMVVMMVPFLIFVMLVLTNKDRRQRVFSNEALKRLRVESASVSTKMRNIVMLIAVFMMILALARPAMNETEQSVEAEGMNMVLALDISASMRSEDNYPNRLEFAKVKISQMLESMMPNDAVEVLAFAHSSFLLTPLTDDKSVVEGMISGVDEEYINQGSTDFEVLGDTVSDMLKDKKPKILVVFSDGGDPKALGDLESVLSDNGITMYTVLVGTKKGAPVLNSRKKIVKNADGSVAMSRLNMELGEIAKRAGGEFLIASNGGDDMKELLEKIRAKFGNIKKGKIKVTQREELFIYPLLLAVVLVLLSMISIPRRKGQI